MIRRANQQQKHGVPPADLLVCFPSRAHLTLIPKKLSSPARLIDSSFRHHRNTHLKKLPSTRLNDSFDKSKNTTTSDDASEPNSPKVTCAGQIKVRPSGNRSSTSGGANCKSWQSVMEEIDRIHKKSKNEKKKASWGDAIGFKKDVMQFLTCLGNLKLDFRCFGAVPESDLSSDDDDEDDEDEEAVRNKRNTNQSESEPVTNDKDSRKVFSDWFMVVKEAETEEASSAAPPPSNALLLMRCRSAPEKNRAKLRVEEDEKEEDTTTYQEEERDQGRKKLRDYLLVMEQYDTDFYKLSNDIANETWVVGSVNPFSRSRSWKR